jgi:hypothetical protein
MKYIAALDQVLEVSLQGSADLAFWGARLEPEGLFPTPDANQRAQIWISGANSKFRGVRFRELSVTVHVSLKEGAKTPDGIFLPQAFNSSRLFTFFERYWFHTPYDRADVDVAATPFRMSARAGTDVLIEAAPGDSELGPIESDRMETWEGPIYLPAAGSSSSAKRRHFFARLEGTTISRPFVADRDQLLIHPAPKFPVLEWLLESRFQGESWAIRPAARHARSRTFYEKA